MADEQGAYGFRITGLGESSPWLQPAPQTYADLAIRHECLRGEPLPNLTGRRFTLSIDATRRLRVERDPAALVVESADPVTDAIVVHPYLMYGAATHAQWNGSLALHGGVVAIDDRAWVLLGDALGGKTTLLAALAQRAFAVLSDDLAIIDRDRVVRSGPRCLDLRGDAVRELGASAPGSPVRGRWRVTLPPAPQGLPLGGFVHLRWASSLAATHAVGVPERTEILVDARTAWGPSSAVALLDIVSAPFVALSRPRRLSAIAETVDVLVSAIGAQPGRLQR